MTLNEAHKLIAAHKALGLNVMEAARRANEISEAYSVVSQNAASRQDAARVAVAVRRARSNDSLSGTFLVSLASDPRGSMAYDVMTAVQELS